VTSNLLIAPVHVSSSDLIVDGGQRLDTGKAEIIHLATLNHFRDQIQRLHWRMIPTSKNMKGQHGQIRYSSWNFIQDILFFVVNYFFSFPENVKKALQSILYLRRDPRPAVDSFPLKIVNTKDLHAFELDQDPFSEFCDDHLQIDEPQETKTDNILAVHTPTPCKILDRYKPLVLPSVLHAFPKNYDLYLPRFDDECKNVNAEQHVQNFESFLDLFEVDEEDVSIRLFALSLQAKVKSWFKALPDASISDFQQFVKVFLDRWMIGQNLFLIVEEYNQLKRLPGEIVQQFSARFNQVYYSMPVDIRPTPRSALLHYPGAFDSEMEFQLRERDIATLHEMQNSAVNVEAHLLIRRARLKEEEMKNIDLEESTSLEVKLDILVSAVEKMMDKINARNDYDVQVHGLLIEEEQVADPKHFVSYPSCQRSDNDCFIDHLGEERTVDMTCMLDDVFYTNDLPQFDQYDDNYVLQTEANIADKSAARLWAEEVHFQQLEYNVQPSHINYDSDEESASKFEVSEGSLPFCFDSFQFITDNYHAIRNQMSTSLDLNHLENNENFVQDFSYSELHPPKAIDCQVAAEDLEVHTHDLMIQGDSVPFCFESFQFLKGRLRSKSSNEQPITNQQSLSVIVEDETDNKILEHPVASDLQPPNAIGCQVADEGMEADRESLILDFRVLVENRENQFWVRGWDTSFVEVFWGNVGDCLDAFEGIE